LSAIHGRQLLSFACPKESNPRKGHPRGRGLPGIPARQTPRAGSGVRREHVPVLSSNARASCARPRAGHAADPAPARRGREGTRKSRARQSLPQKRRIYPTRLLSLPLYFALGFPLSSGGGWTEKPRAPHAGGAMDRADFDNRPWMACGRNPSARSEPSPSARARIRGCLFLWLLSFGQAKESNWPPWMADKPHTDVSR